MHHADAPATAAREYAATAAPLWASVLHTGYEGLRVGVSPNTFCVLLDNRDQSEDSRGVVAPSRIPGN